MTTPSRDFNPNTFETNQPDSPGVSKQNVLRDPYFEKYTYDLFQDMAQNHSELFNFFLENNDILKRISKEDESYLFNKLRQRQEYCTYAFLGTLTGCYVLNKFIIPRFRPTVPKSRGLFLSLSIYFVKYLVPPLLAHQLIDLYLDVDQKFYDTASKYNLQYDDFSQAMTIFERAKLLGYLDELMEKRGDFDFSKLEELPTVERVVTGGFRP